MSFSLSASSLPPDEAIAHLRAQKQPENQAASADAAIKAVEVLFADPEGAFGAKPTLVSVTISGHRWNDSEYAPTTMPSTNISLTVHAVEGVASQ